MVWILKVIAAAILLAVLAIGVFVADMAWNGGGLFYAMIGRDALVRDCTPATKESLIAKGFSPADLVFDPRPSINIMSGSMGRAKVLSAPITFSDGADGPVVRGHLACTVIGHTITVDVDVDALPHRVT